MSINFNTDDSIVLDGVATGLRYMQKHEGTVIYSGRHGGIDYKKYPMPHARYSLAYDALRPLHATPESAAKSPPPAGRTQFEADLRTLVQSITS